MNESQLRREAIAERAYYLWEAAGKPAGRDEEFWTRAESELTAAVASAAPPVIAPPIVAPVPTTTVAPLHEVPPPIKGAVKTPGRRPPLRRTPKRT